MMLNVEVREDVRVVRLEHGKVNALDLELLEAIIDAFQSTPPHQAVVLTGAGRAFSAGVDLRRIVDGAAAYTRPFLIALSDCFLAVYDHPAPVVAAVNGPAIAGGCVLAAACDSALISAGPIGLAELAVGVPFPTSALEIMRGRVGTRLGDLVLGARLLDVEAARAAGLVDEVVAADQVLERALALASRWSGLPAGVFAATKRQLQGPVRERIAARARVDDKVTADLWATPAVRATIEKYLVDLVKR